MKLIFGVLIILLIMIGGWGLWDFHSQPNLKTDTSGPRSSVARLTKIPVSDLDAQFEAQTVLRTNEVDEQKIFYGDERYQQLLSSSSTRQAAHHFYQIAQAAQNNQYAEDSLLNALIDSNPASEISFETVRCYESLCEVTGSQQDSSQWAATAGRLEGEQKADYEVIAMADSHDESGLLLFWALLELKDK